MRNLGALLRLGLLLFVAACGAPVEPPATVASPPPPPSATAPAAAGPPVAKAVDVREALFGVSTNDPYRWMEDDKSPDTTTFYAEQTAYARRVLDAIPGRAALQKRLHELSNLSIAVNSVQQRRDHVFYLATKPGEDNPKLYVRDADGAAERVLVDPDKLGDKAAHAALDWYEPSDDGKLVAYGVSPGGSEDSTVHVVEVAGGRVLPDAIDRAQFASPAWRHDGRSFFYWRRQKPRPDAKPEDTFKNNRVYLHELGKDPDAEKPVFGPGLKGVDASEDDFGFVHTFIGDKWAIGELAHGVAPEVRLYVAPLDRVVPEATPWRMIVDFPELVVSYDVHGDDLYVVTHKDAPGFKILKADLKGTGPLQWKPVLPAGRRVVNFIMAGADGLYVAQRDGGLARLLLIPYGGKPAVELNVPFDGAFDGATNDPTRSGALFTLAGWTRSPAVYRVDARSGSLADTHIASPSTADFSAVESEEVKVKSVDGTLVPLSIVHARDLPRDGTRPLRLLGYGAYGISKDPTFTPLLKAWLERGGSYAVAHVRGGGEYGEDWHHAGREQTKQHTFDDYIACAQYLIDKGYTSAKLLTAEGRSAGGVLVGQVVVQRPDLFRAAVAQVGMLNPLRFEYTAGGPANAVEFGSVKSEAGYKALFAMDPYQHVKDGVAYPAMLFTAGANDPRVPAWQPAKMAARMQKASSSGRPVLLRVDQDAGHGFGSTRTQEESDLADEWAFLLWQLGDPAFQPRTAP